MTEKEEEAIWQLLFSVAFVCGELACTISDDKELQKWCSVGAKEARDKLIKASDRFVKDAGFDIKRFLKKP